LHHQIVITYIKSFVINLVTSAMWNDKISTMTKLHDSTASTWVMLHPASSVFRRRDIINISWSYRLLCPRNCPLRSTSRVPMCGVPFLSAVRSFSALIATRNAERGAYRERNSACAL